MPTQIDAPEFMSRREVVAKMLAAIPRVDQQIFELVVVIKPMSFPTTSFMDELVRQVLVDDLATRLTFEGADEFTRELAEAAASEYGVGERVTFTP